MEGDSSVSDGGGRLFRGLDGGGAECIGTNISSSGCWVLLTGCQGLGFGVSCKMLGLGVYQHP
jgi:hypothetical protein